jgi:hypothetical protein
MADSTVVIHQPGEPGNGTGLHVISQKRKLTYKKVWWDDCSWCYTSCYFPAWGAYKPLQAKKTRHGSVELISDWVILSIPAQYRNSLLWDQIFVPPTVEDEEIEYTDDLEPDDNNGR